MCRCLVTWVLCVLAAACKVEAKQVKNTPEADFQSRQGLGPELSPLLQTSLPQFLPQGQNPLFSQIHQQYPYTARLGLLSQGLPLHLLQAHLGLQRLPGTQLQGFRADGLPGTQPYNLAGQGLFTPPFAGLGAAGIGGAQLLAGPGLLGIQSNVNRLGSLINKRQLGSAQPGQLATGLGVHPLVSLGVGRQDSLAELISLAQLVSETEKRSNIPSASQNSRTQLPATFAQQRNLLNRLISLPSNAPEVPLVTRLPLPLKGHKPLDFLQRLTDHTGSQHGDGGQQPIDLHAPQPFPPLSTAAQRRNRKFEDFRFPQ